jgi:hypothetical protein
MRNRSSPQNSMRHSDEQRLLAGARADQASDGGGDGRGVEQGVSAAFVTAMPRRSSSAWGASIHWELSATCETPSANSVMTRIRVSSMVDFKARLKAGEQGFCARPSGQ